jgi:hypothetical protein
MYQDVVAGGYAMGPEGACFAGLDFNTDVMPLSGSWVKAGLREGHIQT